MRKIPILISGLLFCTSMFSQVSIGLTVGTNICKMKREVDYSSNPNLIVLDKDEQRLLYGLIIGIPVEITLTEKFGLYTAFTYHQKGINAEQSYSFFGTYTEYEGINKFNYLELPVQGKYYFTKKALSIYIAMGPSFGYILNGRFILDGFIIDEADEISYIKFDEKMKSKDLKDSGINRFDISLVIGGGISYNVWIGDVFLNVNYNHGFLDLFNGDEVEIYKGVIQKNRGVNITCGYLFSLSK